MSVPGLSHQRDYFNPKQDNVGFVVDKVVPKQVFL
jgi:hypothetical protein